MLDHRVLTVPSCQVPKLDLISFTYQHLHYIVPLLHRIATAQVLNKGTLRDSTVGSATRVLTEAELPLLSQGDGIWHELTPEGSLQCKVELLHGERAARALRERDGRSSGDAIAGAAAAGESGGVGEGGSSDRDRSGDGTGQGVDASTRMLAPVDVESGQNTSSGLGTTFMIDEDDDESEPPTPTIAPNS